MRISVSATGPSGPKEDLESGGNKVASDFCALTRSSVAAGQSRFSDRERASSKGASIFLSFSHASGCVLQVFPSVGPKRSVRGIAKEWGSSLLPSSGRRARGRRRKGELRKAEMPWL